MVDITDSDPLVNERMTNAVRISPDKYSDGFTDCMPITEKANLRFSEPAVENHIVPIQIVKKTILTKGRKCLEYFFLVWRVVHLN